MCENYKYANYILNSKLLNIFILIMFNKKILKSYLDNYNEVFYINNNNLHACIMDEDKELKNLIMVMIKIKIG